MTLLDAKIKSQFYDLFLFSKNHVKDLYDKVHRFRRLLTANKNKKNVCCLG